MHLLKFPVPWHICNLCHCGIVANILYWADGRDREMDQMPHKFLFATKSEERYSYACFIAGAQGGPAKCNSLSRLYKLFLI